MIMKTTINAQVSLVALCVKEGRRGERKTGNEGMRIKEGRKEGRRGLEGRSRRKEGRRGLEGMDGRQDSRKEV